MKKLILLSVVLCLVSAISAQVRFGVKAGGNFSNLYASQSSNNQYKGRFSYHLAGVMEYSLSEMLSIQPELMYLNHGANLKNTNSYDMQDAHITLNTLQLPINLKATFNSGNTKLFVYGGPYLGFNMYGKVRGKMEGKQTDRELYSKGSNMRRWDYGVGIGVGAEINKFTLTLGNQIGAQNIFGEKNNKTRAGNITLSVGYFF